MSIFQRSQKLWNVDLEEFNIPLLGKRKSSSSSSSSSSSYESSRAIEIALWVVCILFCAAGVVMFCQSYLGSILKWLCELDGIESRGLFLISYVAVSFPLMWGYVVLNIAGGYIYGFWGGLVVTIIGAQLGAFVSFAVCRRLFQEYVNALLTQYKNFKQIVRLVDSSQGMYIVAMTRLTPIPFGLQNAFFSASKIRIRKYFLATLFGLVPTQVVNTYMGTTLRSMEEIVSGNGKSTILFLIQISVAILVSAMIHEKMKKELTKTCAHEIQFSKLSSHAVILDPVRHVHSFNDVPSLVLISDRIDSVDCSYDIMEQGSEEEKRISQENEYAHEQNTHMGSSHEIGMDEKSVAKTLTDERHSSETFSNPSKFFFGSRSLSVSDESNGIATPTSDCSSHAVFIKVYDVAPGVAPQRIVVQDEDEMNEESFSPFHSSHTLNVISAEIDPKRLSLDYMELAAKRAKVLKLTSPPVSPPGSPLASPKRKTHRRTQSLV